MTNFEETIIPYGMYRIDKDYLSYLKKNDSHVLDPEQNLYCGPVLTVYNVKHTCDVAFFVPVVEHSDEEWEGTTQMLANGVFGELDFRRMVPCFEKHITPDKNETKRQKFFTENRKMLESFAKGAYQRQERNTAKQTDA